MNARFDNNNTNGISLSSIGSPASLILIAETRGPDWGPFFGHTYAWADWSWNNEQFNDYGFASHTGQSNYLFVDGHVKSLKPTGTVRAGANLWGKWDDTPTTTSTCTDVFNCSDFSPGASARLMTLERNNN